jgi:hypothetical protein
VKSFNVFKTGKIKLSNLQKIFKRYIVTVYCILYTNLYYALYNTYIN